jgi:hypothetical protein
MADMMMQQKMQKQGSQKIKITIDDFLEKYECPI